jgi:hypothetical protein
MVIGDLGSICLIAMEEQERCVQSNGCRLKKEAAEFTGGFPVATMNFSKMSSDIAS